MIKDYNFCVKINPIFNVPLFFIVTDINLSNLKFLSDKSVNFISQTCKKLKSLNLEKCDQVTDNSINQISSNIPDL